MSEYIHRMTLAVPQSLIPQANQLALIAGESPDDVNTFTNANWQDADGNLYAVCSTVIKPIVLDMFGQTVDNTDAQSAIDVAVMYSDGVKATPDKIVIAIDIEPLLAFEAMGLIMVVSEIDVV